MLRWTFVSRSFVWGGRIWFWNQLFFRAPCRLLPNYRPRPSTLTYIISYFIIIYNPYLGVNGQCRLEPKTFRDNPDGPQMITVLSFRTTAWFFRSSFKPVAMKMASKIFNLLRSNTTM